MKLFLVSYDLLKPGKEYKKLYDELKNSPQWWHYLESTWLIHTSETSIDLAKRLHAHMDSNDNLLVIEVTSDRYGWLPDKAWEWFSSIQH